MSQIISSYKNILVKFSVNYNVAAVVFDVHYDESSLSLSSYNKVDEVTTPPSKMTIIDISLQTTRPNQMNITDIFFENTIKPNQMNITDISLQSTIKPNQMTITNII